MQLVGWLVGSTLPQSESSTYGVYKNVRSFIFLPVFFNIYQLFVVIIKKIKKDFMFSGDFYSNARCL